MKCIWCDQEGAMETTKDCTWIEPTGRDVIVVQNVPAINCPTCQDIYLADEMTEKVEEALNSVDLVGLGAAFTYEELIHAPRQSIFDLYKKGIEILPKGQGACKF